MKLRQLIPMVLLVMVAASLWAADESGPITAGEMASWCEPYRTALLDGASVHVQATPQSQVCFGAFLAVQQLAVTTLPGDPRGALRVCLPETSTTAELIKVFVHFSDTHPELGHRRFSYVLLQSLWSSFPCPSQVAK